MNNFILKLMEKILKAYIELYTRYFISKFRKNRFIWDISKHKYWGNTIALDGDFKNHAIYGFNTDVRIGDEIRIPMQSGRILCGVITKISFKEDPNDMFFGKYKPIEYLDNLKKRKDYNEKKHSELSNYLYMTHNLDRMPDEYNTALG